MTQKLYVNEDEFDRLNWHEQRHYLYCLECGLFYNKSELGHKCNHGMCEGVRQPIKLKLSSAYGHFASDKEA